MSTNNVFYSQRGSLKSVLYTTAMLPNHQQEAVVSIAQSKLGAEDKVSTANSALHYFKSKKELTCHKIC